MNGDDKQEVATSARHDLVEVVASDSNKRSNVFHCPLGCEVHLSRSEVDEHVASTCRNRPKPCRNEGCNALIPFHNISAHEKRYCRVVRERELLTACPSCDEQLPETRMVTHQLYQCKFVFCSVSGCGRKVLRSERGEHEAMLCPVLRRKREQADNFRTRVEMAACPDCKCRIALRDVRNHRAQLCVMRKVACKNIGCGRKVPFSEMEEHQQECAVLARRVEMSVRHHAAMEVVGCPNGCSAEVEARDTQRHILHECVLRVVECGGCKQPVVVKNLPHHETVGCRLAKRRQEMAGRARELRSVQPCVNGCGQDVMIKQRALHELSCRCRPEPCEYGDCNMAVPRNRRQQHAESECESKERRRKDALAASARERLQYGSYTSEGYGADLPKKKRGGGGGGRR